MKLMIRFPLVTGNHYKKMSWKTKRFYLTPAAKAYRLMVRADLIASGFRDCQRFDDYVDVKMVIHPPDKRRRDIDNICKTLWDALTKAGLWADDRLIKNLIVSVADSSKVGYIEMEVTNATVSVPSCAAA